jgi:DnaJ-class molecular chaperone
MAKRDYYEVLGIGRDASDEDIRKAYRRLARKYHPDLNPGDPQAEQKFKELGEAYEALKDPEKRRLYDQFGADWAHAAGAGQAGPGPFRYTWTGQGTPFEDVAFEAFGRSGGAADATSLFEELFSRLGGARGTRTRRASARGQDLESELDLGFEQAVRGVRTSIALERPGGDGREHLQVRVPAGVRDGQRLRVRGKGAPGPGGGPPGDLFLRIRVRPHAYFRRQGDDILLDVPISITEAALGGTVEVPTVHGRTAVRIPPGTAGGARLRLRGQGIAAARTGTRGDQYCIIRIVPPRALDDEGRRLLERLRELQKDDPRAGAPWNTGRKDEP